MTFYMPIIRQSILAIAKCGTFMGAGLLLLAGLTVIWPDFAMAQVSTKGNFGDWVLRCEMLPVSAGATASAGAAPANKESCALLQSLVDDKRPELGLTVMILRHAESGKFILRVLAPLNVNLIRRLGLKIDKADLGRADFSRCDRLGCVADVPFDDMLFTQFKSGQTGVFTYFMAGKEMLPNGEGVGFPLNLTGFDSGMAAIPEIK